MPSPGKSHTHTFPCAVSGKTVNSFRISASPPQPLSASSPSFLELTSVPPDFIDPAHHTPLTLLLCQARYLQYCFHHCKNFSSLALQLSMPEFTAINRLPDRNKQDNIIHDEMSNSIVKDEPMEEVSRPPQHPTSFCCFIFLFWPPLNTDVLLPSPRRVSLPANEAGRKPARTVMSPVPPRLPKRPRRGQPPKMAP